MTNEFAGEVVASPSIVDGLLVSSVWNRFAGPVHPVMSMYSAVKLIKRRTKIVANLGFGRVDPANVARLTHAGVDAFRLDMARGERSEHRDACEHVRAAAADAGRATALIADVGSRATRPDRFVDDARFALQLGVDFLALSTVGPVTDVEELKTLVRDGEQPAKVIAKIDCSLGLEDSAAILDAADALMVASGDLGAELAPEQVPIMQRQLFDRTRAAHKAVIVDTQVLGSMVDNEVPTPAEVSDATATVLGGADAIMLSAETAVGAHALAAVEMTDRIARQAEGYLWGEGAFGTFERSAWPEPPIPVEDAVALSTAELSRQLRVRAIVVLTEGDVSAVNVSSARPSAPVISMSTDARTCRWENLLWGVIPYCIEGTELEYAERVSRELARELGLAAPEDTILLVRGDKIDGGMRMPSITIVTV